MQSLSISVQEAKQQRDKSVVDLYESGKPAHYISSCLGVSYTNVFRILRKHDVEVRNPAKRIWPPLTERQKEIIDGGLLGDASIVRSYKTNGRFQKTQTVSSREYLQWHFDELAPFSKFIGNYKQDKVVKIAGAFAKHGKIDVCTFRTSETKDIGAMREIWYPKGKKIVPESVRITPLSLAVWFCDDGTATPETRSASFCTQGFSVADCFLLSEKIKGAGIVCSVVRSGNGPSIYISRRSFSDLMDMIKPHVPWSCFAYKVDTSKAPPATGKRCRISAPLHYQI